LGSEVKRFCAKNRKKILENPKKSEKLGDSARDRPVEKKNRSLFG
jgi:hypothetical protein